MDRSWFNDISIQTKLLTAFTIPLLLLAFVSVGIYRNTQSMVEDHRWVTHTHKAIARAQELLTLVLDMETGERGYLITGDEEFLEPYAASLLEWDSKLEVLAKQVSDNPPQVVRLGKIDKLQKKWLEKIAAISIEKRRDLAKGQMPSNLVVDKLHAAAGKRIIDSIRSEINTFIQIERILIEQRITNSENSATSTSYALFLGTLLLALSVMGVSFWISYRLKKQLAPLLNATREVSRGNLQRGKAILSVPERICAKDEIGQLANGFCSMTNSLIAHANESQRVNKELKAAADRATAATKAKSDFLSTMSHEIRTPMNGVLGLCQMILDETKEEQTKKNAKIIVESGQHLMTILNDILDFSKIEGGKLELEKIPFRWDDIVTPIQGTIEPLAKEKGIAFNVDNKVAGEIEFTGDIVRLRQVVYNLVGNATKFTEIGSVSISATINQADRRLHIEVSDTGVGISEEKLNTIFNSFEQADTSTTRKFGGTGLGLTIVKKLVDLMDGDIKVSSVVGIGSKFVISLPLPWTVRKSLCDDTQDHQAHSSMGSNVLLVEDNRVNALIAKNFCKKRGFNVDTAENGLIATQMVQDKDYQLIIMDNHMPKMNGIEATHIIRHKFGMDTLIFAYTADVFQEAHDGFINAGADHVLTKPLQEDSFEQALTQFSARFSPSNNVVALHRNKLEDLTLTEEELSQSEILNQTNPSDLPTMLNTIITEFDQALDKLLDAFGEQEPSTLSQIVEPLVTIAKGLELPMLLNQLESITTRLENDQLPSIEKLQMLINRLQVNTHQAKRLLSLQTDGASGSSEIG
ncbi:CHASE3 domain-containing protein [Vibrio sp. S4M6]|uniref:hybrid sensor histidine kinase/response regulator n=1 Tax=Vibrio sinus TaxID=2946865 RepID=UPI00202A3141|nr:CHASE3 domain-containing protein [Vibrio sinus]MCL9782598.1 CHASE3 domain-containing protein [Vibrio sinus]